MPFFIIQNIKLCTYLCVYINTHVYICTYSVEPIVYHLKHVCRSAVWFPLLSVCLSSPATLLCPTQGRSVTGAVRKSEKNKTVCDDHTYKQWLAILPVLSGRGNLWGSLLQLSLWFPPSGRSPVFICFSSEVTLYFSQDKTGCGSRQLYYVTFQCRTI